MIRSASRSFKALVVVFSLSACPAQVDGGDTPEGLGDPCSHTDTVDALCLPGVICVEARTASGGACEEIPADCVDDPCNCIGLSALCDGDVPDLCFEAGDRLSIICEQ